MKQFLVILATIGVAYAGSRTLNPQESLEGLRQFANLCQSGRVPETGVNIGGIQHYCKANGGSQSDTFQHRLTADLGKGIDQTVFVQPPSRDLTHVIAIDATGKGGKTNVLVVPGKVDNKYQIGVTPRITVSKPAITYLQDGS